MTIKEFMKGHATAEIVCPFKRTTVRRLKVMGDTVEVDALTITVYVPDNTDLIYEPWFDDRGSILFWAGSYGMAKFCTEADLVKFPDGTEVFATMPGGTFS